MSQAMSRISWVGRSRAEFPSFPAGCIPPCFRSCIRSGTTAMPACTLVFWSTCPTQTLPSCTENQRPLLLSFGHTRWIKDIVPRCCTREPMCLDLYGELASCFAVSRWDHTAERCCRRSKHRVRLIGEFLRTPHYAPPWR